MTFSFATRRVCKHAPKGLRALLAGIALSLALPAMAQEARPLIREGTTTVYERVLTRPATTRHDAPDGPAIGTYPAFQPLYVFEHAGNWMRVGPSSTKPPEAWVAATSVVDWKQNIVAAFTNSAGRGRQLVFETEERLNWLMNHEAMRQVKQDFLDQADARTLPTSAGIVSVEPAAYVDIQDQLYLMPILEWKKTFHPLNYDETLLLKTASVPLAQADLPEMPAVQTADDFDAGVVFVLDTTQSMERYINRTKSALERIIGDVRDTDIGERINFGIVAFRDNVDAVPGLEYRTKELIPLDRRDDQSPVIEAIKEAANVATANSPGFNEDSLAGVEDAIDNTDWERGGDDPFDGKYVILVTDAGPKGPGDPNARSEIGPAEIQIDAEGKRIVVLTLHLKTDEGGEAQHAYAEAQYRKLSRFNGNEYYYAIQGGSEVAFEETVTTLVTALTDHVRTAIGQDAVLDDEEAGQEMVDLGLALRLDYLGKRQGTRAPDVIEGWVSTKAVEDPLALSIEPRLLVSKNEMATMAELLEKLKTLGEASQGEGGAASFFDQIQGVLADMATDPRRVVNPDSDTLGGALEYLENLPYRSQLLAIDQRTWESSAMQRRTILDGMGQKITQYRKWLFDSAVWTPLYEGADDGDHVFAMPFYALP